MRVAAVLYHFGLWGFVYRSLCTKGDRDAGVIRRIVRRRAVGGVLPVGHNAGVR